MKCTKCNGKNKYDSQYCIYCGAVLNDTSRGKIPQDLLLHRSFIFCVGILLSVILYQLFDLIQLGLRTLTIYGVIEVGILFLCNILLVKRRIEFIPAAFLIYIIYKICIISLDVYFYPAFYIILYMVANVLLTVIVIDLSYLPETWMRKYTNKICFLPGGIIFVLEQRFVYGTNGFFVGIVYFIKTVCMLLCITAVIEWYRKHYLEYKTSLHSEEKIFHFSAADQTIMEFFRSPLLLVLTVVYSVTVLSALAGFSSIFAFTSVLDFLAQIDGLSFLSYISNIINMLLEKIMDNIGVSVASLTAIITFPKLMMVIGLWLITISAHYVHLFKNGVSKGLMIVKTVYIIYGIASTCMWFAFGFFAFTIAESAWLLGEVLQYISIGAIMIGIGNIFLYMYITSSIRGIIDMVKFNHIKYFPDILIVGSYISGGADIIFSRGDINALINGGVVILIGIILSFYNKAISNIDVDAD